MTDSPTTDRASRVEVERITPETKWTSGPWIALPQNGAGPMIVHEFETGNQMSPTGYRLIAHMLQRGNSLEQDRANSALITAAPDLYAALKAVMRADRDGSLLAWAALAKARGEQR